MRGRSRRDLTILILSGVRRVVSDVLLAFVVVCRVSVRLITMGRASTSMHGQWCRRSLTKGCICRVVVVQHGIGYCQCTISTR
jgi:hypothetical protein